MTLTAFYRGRLVWYWDGPTFPDMDLEPIGRGWLYAIGDSPAIGGEALTRLSTDWYRHKSTHSYPRGEDSP